MLQGRLTVALVATALTAAACGDAGESGAIRENVIDPGIEAIEEGGTADTAACGIEASTMRTAIDAYTTLKGEPPANEVVLVDEGFLRSESTLWDVVDGGLIAQDPGCAGVPADVETSDIVTSTPLPPSPDEVYAGFSADDIEVFGGAECAREIAEIFSAGETYVAQTGNAPADLDTLVAGGFLADRPELWEFDGVDLVPSDGSPCPDLTSGP